MSTFIGRHRRNRACAAAARARFRLLLNGKIVSADERNTIQQARAAKPGAWLIVAGGWTDEQFRERRRPTQAELIGAAPDNPVYVQWMYGWALLTPLAYKELNINAESDLPQGAKFVRDSSGNPSGAERG